MSGTASTVETEPETASTDGDGADSSTRTRKRLQATAVVLAGLGFIIGGSLLAPDPQPSGWVTEPASSQPPYSGPEPTIEQVTADLEAATTTAGLGPAAPPRAFTVPGCLASWESYGPVSDTRLNTLMESLTSRQWQPTGRAHKTPSRSYRPFTKGTWSLTVVQDKRGSTSELLSLLALSSTPACEETYKSVQADTIHPV
ncbi:hypothetical protein [Streptomyces erythrochromogenes]|uniref:hypothetical protein n=1 Tax=Streptomyces erythrochromogenes TaxID=285574 RepID=UPI0036CD9810